jgi:hypothetical protein
MTIRTTSSDELSIVAIADQFGIAGTGRLSRSIGDVSDHCGCPGRKTLVYHENLETDDNVLKYHYSQVEAEMMSFQTRAYSSLVRIEAYVRCLNVSRASVSNANDFGFED